MTPRRIRPGVAHITTDDVAIALVPGFDPEAAAAAAEHRAAANMRRLSRDCIDDLRDRGKITTPELRAADEIELVVEWHAGEHSPLSRSRFAERLAATSTPGGASLWLAILDAEMMQFAAWKPWARDFPVKPGLSLYCLTLDVVVHGYGVTQVAKLRRMDRRRVLALLRRSLSRYAHLAGWTKTPDPEDLA